MKIVLFSLIYFLTQHSPEFNKAECTCKGIFLGGIVKIVDCNADFTVRVVQYNEDLIVSKSDFTIGNKCGEWYFTDGPADFTIKFVESNADFTIRFK